MAKASEQLKKSLHLEAVLRLPFNNYVINFYKLLRFVIFYISHFSHFSHEILPFPVATVLPLPALHCTTLSQCQMPKKKKK